MAVRQIPQLEDLVASLPITVGNAGVFEALLRLPYDLYRPIVDLLLDGAIAPEDLVDSLLPRAAGEALLRDAAGAAAVLARAYAEGETSSTTLLARCQTLLAGGEPGAAVLDRDTSAAAIGPDGLPGGGSFAHPPQMFASGDASLCSPNAIQVLRAHSLPLARKQAAVAAAAAFYGKEV